ncbi:HEAT repeat domain-containing protein [Geobacter sulfurreducens subsp. ethanolicus]|uniref:HEAT repeat domain-containing protein n=2 Tax=Geobacter sulfurreducens TaxID=35554 RepID=UPI0025726B6C|nr:HEAT repeat domain-containing protein [Geobacter sulfurreducens]BEH10562.1 HEAT repeat domain-containing protein [Geobacter sulfurreducens subsp. ethanolicus]BET57829.1 HEAT repeat domain-containing protein [Geobacter sp. 60473]
MVELYLHLLNTGMIRDFIVAVNILLFVVTLGLFLTLLFHKVHVERRTRRLAALKERYLEELTHKCYEPSLAIPKPTTALEYDALGAVFATMLVNVSGAMAASVRCFIRELGIDAYYRARVRSRSWVKRYVAVEKLGYFGFPELKPLFRSLLDTERDTRIIPKLVWALSVIADRDDVPFINRVLKDPLFMSAKFNEYIYTNIIRAFRERDQEQELLELLTSLMDEEALPVILKRDIIQACGSEMFLIAKDLAADCFRRFHEVAEMRIACIRTLQRFSAVDMEVLLNECLRDADWRIRGVAAKSAHLYSAAVLGSLRQLLHDESYHVRINSALSLSRMGEAGLEVLVDATRSEDRFVRDVSQYVLKRLIYAS